MRAGRYDKLNFEESKQNFVFMPKEAEQDLWGLKAEMLGYASPWKIYLHILRVPFKIGFNKTKYTPPEQNKGQVPRGRYLAFKTCLFQA